jgi:hypothetical protein
MQAQAHLPARERALGPQRLRVQHDATEKFTQLRDALVSRVMVGFYGCRREQSERFVEGRDQQQCNGPSGGSPAYLHISTPGIGSPKSMSAERLAPYLLPGRRTNGSSMSFLGFILRFSGANPLDPRAIKCKRSLSLKTPSVRRSQGERVRGFHRQRNIDFVLFK